MNGRSIRIFLPDGTPGNLYTAEIVNWTGQVTVFPRLELPRFFRRPEAQRPGVYLMLGPDPQNVDELLAYVGESETLGLRLKRHDKGKSKDFWVTTFTVSSKDANLTKAHVRYLEARLVQVIKQAGRVGLVNGTLTSSVTLSPLPEADQADMEFFLEQLTMLLPVVGFDGVRPKATSTMLQAGGALAAGGPLAAVVSSMPTFALTSSGADARAVEAGGEFTVLQGSTARRAEQPGWTSYRGRRQQLIQQGLIGNHADPELLVFLQDVPFGSTSAAASVVLGRNANGRVSWRKESTDLTYQEWKDLEISQGTGVIQTSVAVQNSAIVPSPGL